MKTLFGNTLVAALMLTAASAIPSAYAAEEPPSTQVSELKPQAEQAIASFKQKDPTIERLFDSSAGYVIFPSVVQGGLGIGAAHGRGLVYEKGKLIGVASVTKTTIGAQIGGQTFAEVIFFETPEALRDFQEGNLELSASVSGNVAATGAADSAKYQHGVVVFTMPKSGLMGQAAIGGQKFNFEPLH